MKNIIIPTDFSENSKHALRYAYKLFQDQNCKFFLVNSYETPHAGAGMLVSIVDVLREESQKDMKDFHNSLIADGLTDGVEYETICDHGSLVEVIKRIHKRYYVNLVVMGTKGAGGLAEVLIGSNTADVIKNGICPTLAIPENAIMKDPKKILLASDNKGFKKKETFTVLNNLSQKFNSEIFVFNVKNSPISTDPTKEIQKLFNDLLEGSNHSFQTEENEDVAEGINNYVDVHNIDMIAMVSRKIGFFESLIHKSITQEMAMHSTVPLLTMFE